MGVFIAIIASALAGAGPPHSTALATPGPVPAQLLTVTEAELQRLVSRLGHPRFSVRQETTRQLCMLDPRHLPDLARCYRANTSYEAKRRLRFVVESIFYRSQITGREGFLGIQIARPLDTSVTDPATGRRTRGVVVFAALEGLPAGLAGLRANDVIISLDGRPLPDEPSSKSFQNAIASRQPGSVIHLRILRPGKIQRVVELSVGDDPRRPVPGVSFGAPPPGIPSGPRVVAVVPGSAADDAGLRANDIVASINGRLLSTAYGPLAEAGLEDVLQTAKPGDRVRLGVLGTEAVSIRVTLGARPTRYLELPDKVEARARFLRWWQDQGGELVLRPAREQPADAPLLPGEAPFPEPEVLVIP